MSGSRKTHGVAARFADSGIRLPWCLPTDGASDAEIENLRLYTVIGQQDVFRFEIAVEDAFAVCRLPCNPETADRIRRRDPARGALPGRARAADRHRESAPLQVGRTGLQQAIVEDVDNRWMLQPRQRLRLLR